MLRNKFTLFNRYGVNLKKAQEVGVRKGLVNGVGMGSVFFVMFGSYALAFWYGSSLVRTDDYTAGTMLIVSFCIRCIYLYYVSHRKVLLSITPRIVSYYVRSVLSNLFQAVGHLKKCHEARVCNDIFLSGPYLPEFKS